MPNVAPMECYALAEAGRIMPRHVYAKVEEAAKKIEDLREQGWRRGTLSIRKVTILPGEPVEAYKAGEILGMPIYVPIC